MTVSLIGAGDCASGALHALATQVQVRNGLRATGMRMTLGTLTVLAPGGLLWTAIF